MAPSSCYAMQWLEKRWGAVRDSVQDKFEEETMNKQTRVINPIYSLLPMEVEGFDSLAELALDMRWSWNHAADEVWGRA